MPILGIVGDSGSGKSSSIRNLDPATTFIISTTGKRPPFKGAAKKYPTFTVADGKTSGNFYTTSSTDKVAKMLQLIDKKMPEVKTVILDDFQYLMSFEAMERGKEKGYDKYLDIATKCFDVLSNALKLREDLMIVIMTHQQNTGTPEDPYYRMKTIGKMLETVVGPAGLMTVELFTRVIPNEDGTVRYTFLTNSDGHCTAKSPMGMFDSMYIPNDLQMVLDTMQKYENAE